MTRREWMLAMTSLALTSRASLAEGGAGPPLWEAVRSPAVITLFGQMNVREDTVWRTEKIERVFRDAQLLWLETPPWSKATPEATRAVAKLKATAVTPDYSVLDHLDESDAARLRAVLLEEGVAGSALKGRAPSDVSDLVSRFGDRRSGANFTDAPETWFRARAEDARKSIRTEWRSVVDAERFALGAPMAAQLDALRLALDELDSAANHPHILAAWANGDVLWYAERAYRMRHRYPALSERMKPGRNAALAARLDVVSRKVERQFVCVDLRRLVGPHSLPDELWDLGFRVHRH